MDGLFPLVGCWLVTVVVACVGNLCVEQICPEVSYITHNSQIQCIHVHTCMKHCFVVVELSYIDEPCGKCAV